MSQTPPRSNLSRKAPAEVVTIQKLMPFVLSPPSSLMLDEEQQSGRTKEFGSRIPPSPRINDVMMLAAPPRMDDASSSSEVSSTSSSDSLSPIEKSKKILYPTNSEDLSSCDPTVASSSCSTSSSFSSPDSASSAASSSGSSFSSPSPEQRDNRQQRRVHFQGVTMDDSPSRMSSTSGTSSSTTTTLNKEEATRAQLVDRVENLEEKVLKYQIELSSEKSQRKRKTRSLVKMAKELTRRERVMREMTAMIAETKSRLAEAELDNKRLLQLLLAKSQQRRRDSTMPRNVRNVNSSLERNCNLLEQPPALPSLQRINHTRRKIANYNRYQEEDDEDKFFNIIASAIVVLSILASVVLLMSAHFDMFSEQSPLAAFKSCDVFSMTLSQWEEKRERLMDVSLASQYNFEGMADAAYNLDDERALATSSPSVPGPSLATILLQATFGCHYPPTPPMKY